MNKPRKNGQKERHKSRKTENFPESPLHKSNTFTDRIASSFCTFDEKVKRKNAIGATKQRNKK